jgi:hypothetical protein
VFCNNGRVVDEKREMGDEDEAENHVADYQRI